MKTVLPLFLVVLMSGYCMSAHILKRQAMYPENIPIVINFQGATVSINKKNDVTLHTFKPATGLPVNSHIIESKNKLIIYDVQFTIPNAKDFLAYAKTLKKPIDRIYISHLHPDHWYGLDVWKNEAPIYALKETINQLKSVGQTFIDNNKPTMKDTIPNAPIIPNKEQLPGVEVIDGVVFSFDKIENTEAPTILAIKLPLQQTMLLSDILYNNFHSFLADKNFANWINTLQVLYGIEGYNYFLVGHLGPADRTAFEKHIQYLKNVEKILSTATTFNEFRTQLNLKYPQYSDSLGIVDLVKKSLFPLEA